MKNKESSFFKEELALQSSREKAYSAAGRVLKMATWNASGGSYASDCATPKTGECVQELCLDNSGVLSVKCLALGVQKLQI